MTPTTNFLTGEDLSRIKGLIDYLNESFVGPDLDVDITVGDSNGERVGLIKLTNEAGYALHYNEH